MIECIRHGHSFLEIEIEQGSVLIDPYISGNKFCKISVADLASKNILAIIITHGHSDHIGDAYDIQIAIPDVPIYTLPAVAKYLTSIGMTHCNGVGIGGTISHGDIFTAKRVPAIHDGAIADSGIYTQPAGVILRIGDRYIYHAGDTALTQEFKTIGELYTIDLAAVPIGGYYTMDEADAVVATGWIRPRIAIPLHYDTFPEIKADPDDRARQVMYAKYAIPKVLKSGQSVVL